MGKSIVPVIAGLLLSMGGVTAQTGSVFPRNSDAADGSGEPLPGARKVVPPVAAEAAPRASPRIAMPPGADLPNLIGRYFDGNVGRRLYIQVDKPLYRPGETIWFKAWDLEARGLSGSNSPATVELVSPKGATVMKKRLRPAAGGAGNDFELPREAQGGEYTLRLTSADGEKTERGVIVSAYEPPRLKKKLEFVKKAYGAGDAVSATVDVRRPTGEVLAGKALVAVITVDGVELPRVKTMSNADGGALVKFDLPRTINAGDGLLTILIEDGGVTESISKSIPIIQKKLALDFHPEGGTMVAGLPARVYFEARNLHGKPADVEGRVVDDRGQTVADFVSVKNGLGRVVFTPASGRSYHAVITRPSNITDTVALPTALARGCVLRAFDDFDGQEEALRIGVRCTDKQKVTVAATTRDKLMDAATVEAGNTTPAVVHLRASDASIQRAAGVARVTVFDNKLDPLAERLVFRNRRERLQVSAQLDKTTYAPRGQVAMTVSTRDASGKPVPAELALSVVDDTVISFADDKSGHLLSKLLLEPELAGKVEEPNFYLDLNEAQSAQALDLLMGARGYRRFEWMAVLKPESSSNVRTAAFARRLQGLDELELRDMVAMAAPPPQAAPAPAMAKPAVAAPGRNDLPAKPMLGMQHAPAPMLENKRIVAEEIAREPAERQRRGGARNEAAVVDKDFERAAGKLAANQVLTWAPVRVFPVPAFVPDYAGPRDDMRETVFWAPSVKTDASGKATLKFVLSDAVTSFRVISEGVGGGLAGRDETVVKSALPFSLSAKLPLEVSAGDKPLIPITLTNDSDRALDVKLDARFGELLKATSEHGTTGAIDFSRGPLAAGDRKSVFVPLDVTGTRGQSQVRLSAAAGGLRDEMLRSIPIVPLGFPQVFERSGQVSGTARHDVDLSRARPGSVQAKVTIHPSMLATTLSGMEGMLREPAGCFEQTSSSNYPNVMIMQYLKQHDVADAALVERAGKLLDSGYRKLAGYESPKHGYEWFGGDPGHEALTAYGLKQFAAMKDVYGAVDVSMLERTSAWLRSRRDGNGGYQRDAKALDSFGRAAPEVTDAYITWALVSAGVSGLDKEIDKTATLAEGTHDAYRLALATGTLLHRPAGQAPSKAALAAAARLAKMQAASGAWTDADHSITRSGGSNLHIETTSLAILALLKADGYVEQARKGVAWLQANRGGFGQWGATQSTVLALEALMRFDDATRVAPHAGAVSLSIDGVVVAEQSYEAGRHEPIVFTGFDDKLTSGKHTVTLTSKGAQPLPYALAVEYRSVEPASSPAAVVQLDAKLAKADVKMGETVRLDAAIRNTTQVGQPMSLVRLGLPGGLTFQNWQLKELREKGQIAFFETRAREVIVYLRDMKPGEEKKLGIDLVAAVPGSYTGPASSAYLYYNDSDKHWAAPLEVRIAP